MQSKLMEIKRELAWEYAVFGDKLKVVQTRLNKLKPDFKTELLTAKAGLSFSTDELPQTELQELLWEQIYLTERLNILENKLKKITALGRIP